MCEQLFPDYSYGFRSNRSSEMVVRDTFAFLHEGYEWIVDINLEKFFDNIPQDKLMSLVHSIISDEDTEVTECRSNVEGQMNELGKELEKRGL